METKKMTPEEIEELRKTNFNDTLSSLDYNFDRLCNFERTHEYCNHCGIVFERFDGGICPICINLDEDESNYDESHLIYLNNKRNKLNREISQLKKANLNN